jgi:hypothetical protein
MRMGVRELLISVSFCCWVRDQRFLSVLLFLSCGLSKKSILLYFRILPCIYPLIFSFILLLHKKSLVSCLSQTWSFLYGFFWLPYYCCTGGTLWHLQKFFNISYLNSIPPSLFFIPYLPIPE